MIEELNNKIRPFLDIHEKLKDVFDLANITTPRIATCGMQSHGKSSTLESITKIELPSRDETCTICPVKICLRQIKNDKEYFTIKLVKEKDKDNEKEKEKEDKYDDLASIKGKIDEYQEKVKKKCNLQDQNITKDYVIQITVHKKDVPNLDLYDLPGVTFVEGVRKEAQEIYESFLKDENTTVLLILNGGDDLTNAYVTEWMKVVEDYRMRFIPIVAKADLIKNFKGRLKQVQKMGLKTKPCLLINKVPKNDRYYKNISDANEIKLIKEKIPGVEKYPVNIGRKQLIDELVKIQYEKYKDNYRDMLKNINNEIKKTEDKIKINEHNLKKLKSSLNEIKKAYQNFYADDNIKEEDIKNLDDNEKNEDDDNNNDEVNENKNNNNDNSDSENNISEEEKKYDDDEQDQNHSDNEDN